MAHERAGDVQEEDRLVEKLRKIEALFARPSTDGERIAAGNALERIRARLRQLEASEPPVEYRFSLSDIWSQSLFVALLRRYGLKPYRYPGQRRTTLMARVTRSFVNDTLWPEFQQLNETLREHLAEVTQRIIAQAICPDVSEAEVRAEPAGMEGKASAPVQSAFESM
ncbi:MAG: hypothetical protein HY049_04405 [Acidobacteria bacterium]|nr:hypothetical protein [Acidobacteriota bacterium]